jgi:hypothetical protein
MRSVLVIQPEGIHPFGRHTYDMIILKWVSKKLDGFVHSTGTTTGSLWHGTEPLDYIKGTKFPDQLNNS